MISRGELDGARKRAGLTLEQLRDKALPKLSIVSLSRKLRGQQSLRHEEFNVLVETIEAELAAKAAQGAA